MQGQIETDDVGGAVEAGRCVIVVDGALPLGLAANAAAVLALTLGALRPELPGADLIDAGGGVHPGLFPRGLPVLQASADELASLRARALELGGVGVIDFPSDGQRTNDYEELRQRVAATPAAELRYLGLVLHGPHKPVAKLTGRLALLGSAS